LDPDPEKQKYPTKKEKVKFHDLQCWIYSFGGAEGFSCSLKALHGGLENTSFIDNKIPVQFCDLDPDPGPGFAKKLGSRTPFKRW
jgi:hypothetical protein